MRQVGHHELRLIRHPQTTSEASLSAAVRVQECSRGNRSERGRGQQPASQATTSQGGLGERLLMKISKIPGVKVDLLQRLVDVDDVGFFFWTLLFLQSRPTVKAWASILCAVCSAGPWNVASHWSVVPNTTGLKTLIRVKMSRKNFESAIDLVSYQTRYGRDQL